MSKLMAVPLEINRNGESKSLFEYARYYYIFIL